MTNWWAKTRWMMTWDAIAPQPGAQRSFQSWGSNSLVYGITTLLQTKFDRSTQFGAVGYIVTLYSSKSYVKSWGSVRILGRSGPSDPQWLRPWPQPRESERGRIAPSYSFAPSKLDLSYTVSVWVIDRLFSQLLLTTHHWLWLLGYVH